MKKLLLSLAVCAVATPAHAFTLVSLHAAPTGVTSVSTGIAVASAVILAGVVTFRLARR